MSGGAVAGAQIVSSFGLAGGAVGINEWLSDKIGGNSTTTNTNINSQNIVFGSSTKSAQKLLSQNKCK